MNQNEFSEVLSIKREKFRVSIRNQRLSQEFQKKRRTYNVQQKKNEFLDRINDELTIYVEKQYFQEEEQNNIKLLLQVILKALQEDTEIDQQFAHNLVKKFRFFVKISRTDKEFLEYICNIIYSTFFLLDQQDFQNFNEFDDPFLLDYFEQVLRTQIDFIPQTLHCILCLMKEKQMYRDLVINNDFEIIIYLTQIDRFRQCSESILAIILEALTYSLGIDLEKFKPIKDYILDSYYEDNLGIRRLVSEIITEMISKLPDSQESEFADQFLETTVFRKIFAEANKPSFDFLSQNIVLQCFGLCTKLNNQQIQFFQTVLQQKLATFEVNSRIRVQLYWAISNKIINREFLNQMMPIVQYIIKNYQDGPIMIQNELSFVILNLVRIANLEELSKILKMGMIDAFMFLFSLEELQIQTNILQSLILLLKKFEQNQDVNNDLIMSFEEIKQRVEKNQLVEQILASKCDQKLINNFDVYF